MLRRKRGRSERHRRGAVVVQVAVLGTILVGFAALSVDVGAMYVVRAELQRCADSAALAAASALASYSPGVSEQEAIARAQEVVAANPVWGKELQLDPARDVIFGQARWNSQTDRYEFAALSHGVPSAVEVRVRLTHDSPNGPMKLMFANIFGKGEKEMWAVARAMVLPRDIMLVIDCSASMNDDSELRNEPFTDINIKEIWEALGKPTFGKMTVWHNSYSQMPRLYGSVSSIKKQLGLDKVPYPYRRGSWSQYISYVKYSMTIDGERYYRNRYGLRTFINYLLRMPDGGPLPPELAGTPEQPITAVKDAVALLVDYLQSVNADDWLGLTTYSETSRIELHLTNDYSRVLERVYSIHAGYFGRYTNIGAGINHAREELTSPRSRPYARKVMIVLTDGRANRPPSNARGNVVQQTEHAVRDGVQIHCISLGSLADTELMEQVAEMGGGEHFYVPTDDISQYEEDLKAVFRTIGGKRPVRLIW